MRQATNTPTPTPYPTVTATPNWHWATPTLLPTSAATSFLDGVVPTVVESYARSAEYAVQMYNVSNQPGLAGIGRIDYVFLAMMVVVLMIAMARLWKRIREFGVNEGD